MTIHHGFTKLLAPKVVHRFKLTGNIFLPLQYNTEKLQ